jgi:hypothetical protein
MVVKTNNANKEISITSVILFGLVACILYGVGTGIRSDIGILFFCHQIGAFLSAYLSGALLEATGGYQAVWLIDVALCAFASIMSYLTRK